MGRRCERDDIVEKSGGQGWEMRTVVEKWMENGYLVQESLYVRLYYRTNALSTKPHLNVGIVIQRPQENLVSHTLVVLHVKDLGKTDLPRRIA